MTQTQTLTPNTRYSDEFIGQPAGAPHWLWELRSKGFDNFSRLGFPTARKGNEAWKYTNVAPIARTVFSLPQFYELPSKERLRTAVPWSEDWNTLVFVNGNYKQELSAIHEPDALMLDSLFHAGVRGDETLAESLGGLASVEDDAFAALNTAFLDEGAVVRVPSGARMERPAHLVFLSTEDEDRFVTHPRVLVIADRDAEATIIESYVGVGENPYFTNAVAEIVVGEGAKVEHYRLMDESEQSYHVGVARVHQKDGSSFSSRAFYKGVGLGRHDLYVHIGDGCETDLSGLYITSGSQHMDNFINIDHAQPNSTSRLYYKGILSGRSRAVFGGTVFVREGADKTDAQQSDKNLLLSPDAEVDSKPALFIWADDVKCGHGATAGNVDEDTVFYMRSRGVDLETASRLLIFGFASEIVDTVAVPELHGYLERSFLEAIPKYEFRF